MMVLASTVQFNNLEERNFLRYLLFLFSRVNDFPPPLVKFLSSHCEFVISQTINRATDFHLFDSILIASAVF